MRNAAVIVVAAGEGRRFGSYKPLALLKGKPVLDRCLEKFNDHHRVAEIILVLRDKAHKKQYLSRYPRIRDVVAGGRERQDSVLAGFRLVDPDNTEVVLVHDGARPLVDNDLIDRVLEAAEKAGAAIPVLPVEETLKLVEEEKVLGTVERKIICRAQTPQGFRYGLLKEALEQAEKEGFYGTDEALLVERLGKAVKAIPGDPRNIKITTPEDLKMAEALLAD